MDDPAGTHGTSLDLQRTSRSLSPVAIAVGIAAAAVLIAAVMAGFGTRWGLWHFRTGFSILRWSAYAGVALGIAAVAAAAYTRPGSGRRGFVLTLLALAVAVAVVAIPWQWRRTASGVPPIHDITTDVTDPPQFVAVAPLRASDPNPIEYQGAEVATQQQAAYPDIRPLILDLAPDAAFRTALQAAEQMGWTIVAADSVQRRIEATDRTFWFGFRDDVVVRLTQVDANRTVVDVRSKSRVGRGDAGTNARRVRSYLRKLGADRDG